jgi:hypothetical protein
MTTLERTSVKVLALACLQLACISHDSVCTALSKAQCDKRSACTNDAGITRTYGDSSTCLTREKMICLARLSAEGTDNQALTMQHCADNLSKVSCADFIEGHLSGDCAPVGTLDNGSSCNFNVQCASGFCANDRYASCGSCDDAPDTEASCLSSLCGSGQVCVSTTSLCENYVHLGGVCNDQFPCGVDLACVGATANAMGTCQAPSSTAGGTCPCDGTQGLSCDSTSMKCVATPFVAAGMPCGRVNGVFVGCAGAGVCYAATHVAGAGETGQCQTPAADGAACDTTVGPPCLSPARCVTTSGTAGAGTCLVPGATSCF